MCFSAKASFISAAFLGVAGILTVAKAKDRKSQLLLAVIPLIFALQQLVEGFLWIAVHNPFEYAGHIRTATYGFLSIALLVWPVWIPLSLFMVEGVKWRKQVLGALLALGVVFDAILIYHAVFNPLYTISMFVQGDHLQYNLPAAYGYIYFAVYTALVILPPFISSFSYMWLLGIANVLGLIAAWVFYSTTFVSVWCFFAAWFSLFLLYVLYRQSSNPKNGKAIRNKKEAKANGAKKVGRSKARRKVAE